MASFGVYNDQLGRTSVPATKRDRMRLSRIRAPRRAKPLHNLPRPQLAAHRTSIILQGNGTLDGLAYSSDLANRSTNVKMAPRQLSDGSGKKDKPLPPTPGQALSSNLRAMRSQPDLSKSREHSPDPPYYKMSPNQTMVNFGAVSRGSDFDRVSLSHKPVQGLPQSYSRPDLHDKHIKFGPQRSSSTQFVSGTTQHPSSGKKMSAFKKLLSSKKSHVANTRSASKLSIVTPAPFEEVDHSDIRDRKAIDDHFHDPDLLDSPSDDEFESLPSRGTLSLDSPKPSDAPNTKVTALPQSRSQYDFTAPAENRRRTGMGMLGMMKGALSSMSTHSSKHKRSTTVSVQDLHNNVKQNIEGKREVLGKRVDLSGYQTSAPAVEKPRHSYFPTKVKGTTQKLQKAAPEVMSRTPPNEQEEESEYPYVEPPAGLLQKALATHDHTPVLQTVPNKPWDPDYAERMGLGGFQLAPRLPAINPLRQHTNVMEFAKPPTDRAIQALGTVDDSTAIASPPSTGVSVRSEPLRSELVYSRTQTSSRLTSYCSEPGHPLDGDEPDSPSASPAYASANRHTISSGRKGYPCREGNTSRLAEFRFTNSYPSSPHYRSQTSLSGERSPSTAFDRSTGTDSRYPRENSDWSIGMGASDSVSSLDYLLGYGQSNLDLRGGPFSANHMASLPGGSLLPLKSAQSYPGGLEYRRQGVAIRDSPLKRNPNTNSTDSFYELYEDQARLYNDRGWTNPPDYSDSDSGMLRPSDQDVSGLTMKQRLSMVPEAMENRNSGSTISRRHSADVGTVMASPVDARRRSISQLLEARLSGQSTNSKEALKAHRNSVGSSAGSSKTLRRRRQTKLSISLSQEEREDLSAHMYGKDRATEGAVGQSHVCGKELSRRRSTNSDFSIASSFADEADNYGDGGFELGQAQAVPIVFSGKAKLVDIPPRKKK